MIYYVITLEKKDDSNDKDISYMTYNNIRGYFVPNSNFNRAYQFETHEKACDIRDSLANIEESMRDNESGDVSFIVKEYTLSETAEY